MNFRNKAVQVVSTLRLWSPISSPQIRQSEARCCTWISIRLINLFWPSKEKRQRLVLMRKEVITLLCEKPGSGQSTCFGPRNSKIVYQNSWLSTIPTFNMIKVNRYDLSYVHNVFGFQLLLTCSILNSRRIKTIPNFSFKKNMTSYSDKFCKQVFENDWHVALY